MSRTSEPSRVPNLDAILARLAELAPSDPDTSTSAPVPETSASRRAPRLDLDRIAEATEALVPAGAATIEEETATIDEDSTRPVIDLRDRAEPDSGVEAVVAEAIVDAVVAEGHVVASEVEAPDLEDAIGPVGGEPATAPPMPPAEIDLHPVEPVEVSRAEPISTPGAAPGRGAPAKPTARVRNPFKRLIIWSILLGLGLLVGALILLVT